MDTGRGAEEVNERSSYHPIFSEEKSVIKLGNAYYVALPRKWVGETKRVKISVYEMSYREILLKIEKVSEDDNG